MLIWGGGSSEGHRLLGEARKRGSHSHLPHSGVTDQECRGTRRPRLSLSQSVWSSPVPVGCPSRWALNQRARLSPRRGRHTAWTPANAAAQQPIPWRVCLLGSRTVGSERDPPSGARAGWTPGLARVSPEMSQPGKQRRSDRPEFEVRLSRSGSLASVSSSRKWVLVTGPISLGS